MNPQRLAARLSRRVSRNPQWSLIRECTSRSGARVYLVGGPVRDTALGRPAHDADLAVVGGTAALVRELRRALGTGGFRFRKRGVTTWRFASPWGEVDAVDAVRRGLEGDLRRRELTVNAIAYDLVERTVADPLNGLGDLRAGLLRAPREDAFRDDPLRCLRAARFLADLPGFRLERRTKAWLKAECGRLRRVSVERLRDELDKMLSAEHPQRGLDAAQAWGVLQAALPELAPLRGCAAGRGRPDVWRHTVDTIGVSAQRPRLPSYAVVRQRGELVLVRWTLLLHDIAKPATLGRDPRGRPTFHGHEVLGASMATDLLRRLRFDASTRRRIRRLVLWHLRPGHLADAGAPARGMRRLAREAGDDLPALCLHAACDAQGTGGPPDAARWRRLNRVLRALPEVQARLRLIAPDPLVSGTDVMRVTGLVPGPRIGTLLRRIAEARDDGEITTRRQALAWLQRRD